MAAALVTFLVEELASSVIQEMKNEVGLVAGVKEEVENITKDFKAIQAVLNNAEQRQIKEELVKDWLEDLKEVAYDMEDVLDKWRTTILIIKSQGLHHDRMRNKVFSIICSPITFYRQLALRHNVGSRIKQLKDQLVLINSRKNEYKLVDISGAKVSHGDERQTSSIVDATELYGRDVDKNILVSWLLGECGTSSTQDVDGMAGTHPISNPLIISIVGMGGLGKTTLAQFAFNDPKVRKHFDQIVWFCVSDPFDRRKLAEVIICKIEGPTPRTSVWEDLHTSLCKSVEGKRFLLVLDDVWDHDQKMWDELMLSFKFGAPGSRILVTTRNERVAMRMGTTHKYPLRILSDDECWSLVSHVAFGKREKKVDKVLEEIGKKIAAKCQGLPLAAKFLGGLLSEKRTTNEWEIVLENDIWDLEQQGDSKYYLTPSLLLSYFDLSPPLQRCFTYCTIFPKDTIIKKNELVLLWMAQGLLTSKRNDGEFETQGEDYFEKLTMRSFFQDLHKDNDGNVVWCKMHDLVHDFAQFLTEKECVTISSNNHERLLENSAKVRHLTTSNRSFHVSIYNAKNLRTLYLVKSGWSSYLNATPSDLCRHLRCLRVLQLNYTGLRRLPSEIKKLIHLRYLDLSRNEKLNELPESICSLYNLQTLNLENCSTLFNLPKGIGELRNLRHLMVEGTNHLKYFPEGIEKLTSLRTLVKLIVRGGCKGLNLLSCEDVSGLGSLRAANEASQAVSMKKKYLRRNLKELYITDYPFFKFPNSMWDLYHLHHLELKDCINCTELPALGKLLSLKVLKICGLPRLNKIGREFYGVCGSRANQVSFPKLTELYIEELDNLEEWDLIVGGEETINIMPCLSTLRMEGIGKLKLLPAFGRLPSLEDLHIEGAGEVERIGSEFYGIGGVNIAFPKLTSLWLSDMDMLELWELGEEEKDKWNRGEIIIMPCLRQVNFLAFSTKLRKVSALGKLPCLEVLSIGGLDESVRHIGLTDFFGIDSGTCINEVVFPQLKELRLSHMENLEELELGMTTGGGHVQTIMPRLSRISLSFLSNLKALAHDLPETLSELKLWHCPELALGPTSAAYHLVEKLELDGDCGVFTRGSLSFLPNLKSLVIKFAPETAKHLPESLSQLKQLQSLSIRFSDSIECMPKEVQHLTNLQELEIYKCKILGPRCEKDKGEDWSIISHIPYIHIVNE